MTEPSAEASAGSNQAFQRPPFENLDQTLRDGLFISLSMNMTISTYQIVFLLYVAVTVLYRTFKPNPAPTSNEEFDYAATDVDVDFGNQKLSDVVLNIIEPVFKFAVCLFAFFGVLEPLKFWYVLPMVIILGMLTVMDIVTCNCYPHLFGLTPFDLLFNLVHFFFFVNNLVLSVLSVLYLKNYSDVVGINGSNRTLLQDLNDILSQNFGFVF